MSSLSRRAIIRGTAAVIPLAILAACGATTPAQVIAMTQTILSDLQSEVTAFANIKGLLPAATVTEIDTAITTVQSAISGFSVGQLVPVTNLTTLLTDLQTADTAAATVLPGNPIVTAIGVVLAALQLSAGLFVAGASPEAGTLGAARQRLLALPAARW